MPLAEPAGGVYFGPVPLVKISYCSPLLVVMISLRLAFFSMKLFSEASFAEANASSRSETILS